MAPPRSAGTSAKRSARARAPNPNPNPAPPAIAVDVEPNLQRQLQHEMRYGKLREMNRLVEEARRGRGVGALHYAAKTRMLPVCRYLVEQLGVDLDALDGKDATPLVYAIVNGNVDIVSYLLDRGADPGKANGKGLTALHYAAKTGDCKVVELLLAKGVFIDPVSVSGTPLHVAAVDGHDEVMELLLKNNADYNKVLPGVDTPLHAAITASSVKCVKLLVEAGADVNDGLVTPLASAVENGLTACLKCLLEAGADPNVPGPSGKMPIEIAALKGTREDVEILFPVTSCIPTVHDWSIDGIICHAKSVLMEQGECSKIRKIGEWRSLAANSIKRKDYITAATLYSKALEHDRHDATLLSKRSLCRLRMGDGQTALQDALACREMRPNWPKAWYRQGAALMFLKDYEGACDAFLAAAKLDPLSAEIESALRFRSSGLFDAIPCTGGAPPYATSFPLRSEALDSLKISHSHGTRKAV